MLIIKVLLIIGAMLGGLATYCETNDCNSVSISSLLVQNEINGAD